MKEVGKIVLISFISAFVSIITFLTLINFNTKSYHQYDVNRDGKVSAADYVAIKNYIMKEGE